MFWIFLGGSKWDPCLQTFCIESTYLGGTSPYILHNVKFIPPPAPVVQKCCRGTQKIPISSMNGMHRYENLQPNYEKKVLGRGTFVKG